jgi:hypothetical protein
MPARSRLLLRNSAFAVLLAASAAHAGDARLQALAAAYPEKITGIEANAIVFRDGTRVDAGSADPNKPMAALLREATILDQLRLPYPKGAPIMAPHKDFDPGRFRNEAFFDALYGDCRKGDVAKRLVPVVWLPNHWGHVVMVTRANSVADHLRAVSAELDTLPDKIARAAFPTTGTYVCRPVKDTGRLSMHAYGAAIDLNLKLSNYWLWEAKGTANIPYRNVMPHEIVDVFERHGFIWGGRWYHYDTMHFEYRPEMLGSRS